MPSNPQKSSVVKVRTALVLVPAIVSDRSGKRVSDLKQQDFAVLQNGKPQSIALFDHVQTDAKLMQRAPVSANVVTNAVETKTQRLTIFMLDFLNSSYLEQRTGREELLQALSKSLNGKEPICLLAIDNDGLKVVHDFTTDPAVLADALKAITARGSSKDTVPDDPMETMYRNMHGWHTKSMTRIYASTQGRLAMLASVNEQRELSESARIMFTLEALRQIGEAFIGLPGRKSLIWATGGFPFAIDDASQFGAHDHALLPVYESTWRALNGANIAVYPLDVEDLVNPVTVNASLGELPPQHHASVPIAANLEKFAEVTGGRLCDRSMDAKACMHLAAEDSSDYYLIGFYESADAPKPGWQKLAVRVERPGLQVRARSGYYSSGSQSDEKGRQLDLQMALTSPLDFTAIPLTVSWVSKTVVADSEKRHIAFSFEIAHKDVPLDEHDSNRVSLDFAALATTPMGAPAGSFSQTVDGRLKSTSADAVKSSGITFPGSLDLPPGEYTVTFAVRDNLTGRMGSASTPLVVQ